jgi:hypothetical protein
MRFFDLQSVGEAERCHRAASTHCSGVLFPESSFNGAFLVIGVEQVVVGVSARAQ